MQGKFCPTTKELKILEKPIQDMEISSQRTQILFMSLIGVLASLKKTIPIGQLRMCPPSMVSPVTRFLDSCFKPEKSSSVVQKSKIVKIGCLLHPKEHNTLIFTDALNQGFGSPSRKHDCQWLLERSRKSITYQCHRIKGSVSIPKSFQSKILNKRNLIRQGHCNQSSEQTGGTHSWDLYPLVWRILAYCNPQNIQNQTCS